MVPYITYDGAPGAPFSFVGDADNLTNGIIEIWLPGDDGPPNGTGSGIGPYWLIIHWISVTITAGTNTTFIRTYLQGNDADTIWEYGKIVTAPSGSRDTLRIDFPKGQRIERLDDTDHHGIYRLSATTNGSGSSIVNFSCGYDVR
jgi:hypothetical protein